MFFFYVADQILCTKEHTLFRKGNKMYWKNDNVSTRSDCSSWTIAPV